MRQGRKKITTAKFLWLWCAVVFLVIAIAMLVVVNHLVELATQEAVRRELNTLMRQVVNSVEITDGMPRIPETFRIKKEEYYVVVLDEYGNWLDGDFPENFNMDVEVQPKLGIHSVTCGEEQYFVFDRNKKYYLNDDKHRYYVRGIVNKKDVDTVYHQIEETFYVLLIIMALALVLFGFYLRKRISKPMQKMCEQAADIEKDLNYSKRIEYEGYFYEMDTLINAYNNLLDKTEHLLRRQEQFNGDVSHELRTPVAVIRAQCQLTKEKNFDQLDAETKEAFSIIESQTNRMNGMIELLIHLSRIDQDKTKLDLEEVDLVDIVESVCEDAEDLSEGKQVFQYHLQEAITKVDIGLITMAIRNLVSNAMKYSPDDSEIHVYSGCRENTIYVTVEDFGCGIAKEDYEKIFEYYYRAEKSRNSEGFGLGLTLAMKVAKKHGGTIEIESEIGKGSKFTLILPKI